MMMAVIPPDMLDEATLTVDNPREVAVTVYAQSDQFDTRLGRVPTGERATLRFPTSVVQPGRTLRVFVTLVPSGSIVKRLKVALA